MSNTSSSKAKLNRSPRVTRCSARYVLQSRHPKFARCSLIQAFHDGITRQHMRTHAKTQTQSRTHADTNATQTQTQTQTPPPPPQLWQKPQPQSAPTTGAATREKEGEGDQCSVYVVVRARCRASCHLASGAPCAEPSVSVRPEGGPLRAKVHPQSEYCASS